MYFASGGALVRKQLDYPPTDVAWTDGGLLARWGAYGRIYRTQLWVAVLVNKLAAAQARLPLKVYRRAPDGGREPVPDHPYARLLADPSTRHAPYVFWSWTVSTLAIYGTASWAKRRDAGGRPVELVPLHPSGLSRHVRDDGTVYWTWRGPTVSVVDIPDADIVHFHAYHPDDPARGLSPLEPLRATLENEDAARRATSSFWERGARPGTVLTHPGNLSQAAANRLKVQWNELAAGADRTGATVVLEEGMKPEKVSLTAEEAQYIESRRLNREEACAAYDVPPPVVHILDRATYSNITEQMRSMYRDTMAPRLAHVESVLESGLRGSIREGATEPDFGGDVYAEYLLDDVLRGDFETRADAIQKALNSGQLTPNEARRMENRPAMPGGDTLLVNSTMIPLEQALAARTQPAPPGGRAAGGALRAVMGRLSRPAAPAAVDPAALVDGLDPDMTRTVLAELAAAVNLGEDMTGLRDRIRALAAKETPS